MKFLHLTRSTAAVLKPRAASDLHGMDKAVDRAMTELRAGKPDAKASEQSLKALLAVTGAAK